MSESIKKLISEIAGCSKIPTHDCIYPSILSYIMERIRELPYKEFLSVYEYAKSLILPEEFLKELQIEYSIRNSS